MSWIVELFTVDSIAQAVLILSLVTVLGLALGNLRIKTLSLGVAGVLFSGLVFGHFGFTINPEIMEFAREFGLILFVYTIGIEVGPGFLASLRKQGLPLNLMAAAVVLLGGAVTVGLFFFAHIPMPVAVGLFSGGTTNTPSLAAAQQALKQIPGIAESLTKMPGLGYAIAYPFGVIGIILVMIFLRVVFRVDPRKEAKALEALRTREIKRLKTINIEVTNPNLNGLAISKIPTVADSGVVISRIYRAEQSVEVPKADTLVQLGDILHAVGTKDQLDELKLIVGKESCVDLKEVPSNLAAERILVTKRHVLGKSITELEILDSYGVVVTRIIRTGLEFTPNARFRLQFGDELMVVGEKEAIQKVAADFGNSPQALHHPHIIPIFVGIALGILVGSFPLHFPGMPAAVKLGLAGGPLVIAIILSRIGQVGSLIWYLPVGANLVLRHIGIALFLACVGLKAGDNFVETLFEGGGLYWMLCATLITLVPLLLVALVARMVYRLNYLSLCGLLAGSMTDPPALAFANSLVPSSDGVSIAYASVYPLTMLLRVFSAQILVLFFFH
jgi:putative transport protein